ncbi:ABC transporter ATP-binding protein [Wenxinia saemankumensis]|uniref:Peptide/nickel transport system ATP-binding protein n=1 Tax=Wenxinia saemankumensis TaxID=1447782 RepID=A0A1M6HSQ6_9RHOB|nr:ABC transporter ATP-binding protein [Wenxinia saemankumensis]SHJ25239.1 peptide/nickel transport system ATP-binding protein [Wenxinia saemankumensis]
MSAVLEIDDVSKRFRSGGLLSARTVEAVKNVSFTLEADRPEVFAIVGQSGSGKSTLANMILGSEMPSAGRIRVHGEDITDARSARQRIDFMRRVQPIFQNPFEAFNPLTRIDSYLFSTARRFRDATGAKAQEALADEALQLVGLTIEEVRGRYSHELSGGQLQRIAVARALIPQPDLIVADEPVSMVDASLRMSIVNLFKDLRDRLGVTIVYITHDLATAYYIADRLIIMKSGEIVEQGPAKAVLDDPQHPYSRALRDAILPPDPRRAHEIIAG